MVAYGPWNQVEKPAGVGWLLVLAQGRTGATETWDVYMQHVASGARVPEGPCIHWSFEQAEREGERMIAVHDYPPAPDLSSLVKCWACRHLAKTDRSGRVFAAHTIEGYYCPGSYTDPRPLD